jgi:thioredoxin-disulfide reductase
MEKYDLIIIGVGPAGLTAAIYAARYKLNVLAIGESFGGMAGKAYEVCNFPSYENVKGPELMMKMTNQVKELGVEIKYEKVLEIKNEDEFKVITKDKEYFAKKIIFATGSERKKLGIENEEEFVGKGVHYCATCDASFYKDKIAGVVGGSDSALTAALLLTQFAKKVYVIYRKEEFCRAEPIWVDEVKKNKKIIPIFNSNVTKLIGDKKLEEIELDTGKNLKINGLFIEIGSIPNTNLAKKINVKIDCENIEVDKKQKTNIDGFFAAGDITNNPLKQIITACGEGAVAADTAYNELKKIS